MTRLWPHVGNSPRDKNLKLRGTGVSGPLHSVLDILKLCKSRVWGPVN